MNSNNIKGIAAACSTITNNDMAELMTMRARDLMNAGANSIAQHEFTTAIATLSEALRCCKLALGGYRHDSSTNNNIDHHRHHDTIQLFDDCMVKPAHNTILFAEQHHDRKSIYVYVHPIQIPKSTECPSSPILSLMVMFNLALAHHLAAIVLLGQAHQTRSNNNNNNINECVTYLLQQATSFYRLTQKAAEDENIQTTVLFPLTIMNNLGHVYYIAQKRQLAALCFRQVLSTCIYVQQCDNGVHIPELDGFWSNTTLLWEPDSAAAA